MEGVSVQQFVVGTGVSCRLLRESGDAGLCALVFLGPCKGQSKGFDVYICCGVMKARFRITCEN